MPIKRKDLPRRFLEVVVKTRGTRASSFANDYLRMPQWIYSKEAKPPRNYQQDIPVFWYILTNQKRGYLEKISAAEAEGEKTRRDHEEVKKDASDEEQRQTPWLDKYEQQLVDALNKRVVTLEDLWRCLIGPKELA